MLKAGGMGKTLRMLWCNFLFLEKELRHFQDWYLEANKVMGKMGKTLTVCRGTVLNASPVNSFNPNGNLVMRPHHYPLFMSEETER